MIRDNRILVANNITILGLITIGWLAYSCLYIYFKETSHTVASGMLALIGESGLDLIAAILAYFSWKKSEENTKNFFFLLMIAFAAAFLADTIYNFLLNIKQTQINTFNDSLFDIPFAVFLFFQALAWVLLFIKSRHYELIKLKSYLPYIFAAAAIFCSFMFGIEWKIKYFSVIGLYQIVDTLFEVFGFLFASFCLVFSKKTWLKFLSIGYLIIISSDLIIRYSVVENTIITVNPLETTWILGLILVVTGFFLSEKSEKLKALH